MIGALLRRLGRPAAAADRTMMWLLSIQGCAIAAVLVVASDIYAHVQVDPLGSVNNWGYRGPVAHAKRAKEVRVLVVGGTRAFGWGLVASQATAPSLYTVMMLDVDKPGTSPPPLVVINVGRLGDLPDSYPATIEEYAYLQPDYICLYDDLGIPGAVRRLNESGVFALTGYAPVLPLVLREKGMLLQFGSVEGGYMPAGRARETRSRGRRLAGIALQAVGAGAAAVDRGLLHVVQPSRFGPSRSTSGAASYAEQISVAIEVAHRHARGVVLAISPAELDEQRRNVAALEAVTGRLTGTPWFRLVNLERVPELSDRNLRLDGWNYGGEATWAVARRVSPALLDLMGYK